MGDRTATVYVDYQQRASEFAVGDRVVLFGLRPASAGRVTAVYPAIGQVDVEFPHGSGRYPVEDLQRIADSGVDPPDEAHTTVPGGAGSVGVPGGPMPRTAAEAVDRVARAYVKQALYWASKDRHYKATREECDSGRYACPKCKRNADLDEVPLLRPANYKRVDGQSHKLLGCPHCLFLIKREHILGDPAYDAHVHTDDHTEDGDDLLDEDVPLDTLEADWDGTMDQGFESVRQVKNAGADGGMGSSARTPQMTLDVL